MSTPTLSTQFQIMMYGLATVFWVLNWIPGLNIITNAIYWIIWTGIFFFKYWPLLQSIAKTGTSLGVIQLKIGFINFFAFILGEIPFISMLPWDLLANWLTNRLVKEKIAKIENVKKLEKNADELKQAWQNRPQGRRIVVK